MRGVGKVFIVVSLAMAAASMGVSQPPGGGGGGGGKGKGAKDPDIVTLLQNPQVKAALEITDQQLEKLPTASLKALAEVLNPTQVKRLREIYLQQRGNAAFLDSDVKNDLKITADQAKKIQGTVDDLTKQQNDFAEAGDFAKTQELQNAATAKIQGILTAEQKTAWAKMLGQPIQIAGGGKGGPGGKGGGMGGKASPKGKTVPPGFHEPANAVTNLTVNPTFELTLFASEPILTNPTNIDIDRRGRVWVCDVQNYRGNKSTRPKGDKILILEDTDGDGKCDKVKEFYQGKDIDAALGICVLGNKVIVTCSPNVIVFTKDDNDNILKKEYLFTKAGGVQHDHGIHSFMFGPDGKLYWNGGNETKTLSDKDGKPVIDLAGNQVITNGKPYRDGMVFRCDVDGRNFEVLGNNFRNNYEVTVDSFGTLWQSDNDDDGNRGVRVNYVMEFGNFGYRDETTGAGWQAARTNIESDVPLRHWHQNDPGVVPNLLNTGAGSPCGIMVYEANLFPKLFHNQIIHADAGPSVVRAYPRTNDGAGYKATMVDLVSDDNNWFRPVGLRVAPDGSLFISDWYDPGVGGHQQRDKDRGRIFRLAPPKTKYVNPTFDFSTVAGAAQALKNANLEVRYHAWTFLHQQQAKAEPELLKLWQSDDPVYRARALWLLGKIEGKGQHYVDLALKDPDADIRIVGLRLARQLKLNLPNAVATVVRDPSPQVRRDASIALRFVGTPQAAQLWAELAQQHDGKDRWYVEALGIGADLHADARFDAWLKAVGDKWNTPAGRDIVWRSRAAKTADYLARIIADPTLATAELPRYFRAFDFQKAQAKEEALLRLVVLDPKESSRQQLIVSESVNRLTKVDPAKNPRYAAALEGLLENVRGTSQFVQLVSKLNLAARYPQVLAIAQKNADGQLGVDAILALLDKKQTALIEQGLHDKDAETAVNIAKVLGTAADARGVGPLLAVVKDKQQPLDVRRQAVRALARSLSGAKAVVDLARDKQLAPELTPVAGFALQTSGFPDVREQAAKLFALAPAKNDEPLPALRDLLQRRGDIARGKELFAGAGTCANCHKINGAGKDVGPDLSEIGKKLAREAIVEKILFPSAAINHNFEQYVLLAKNGTTMNGILVSQTPEEVTLKGADAIVRTFKRAEIDTLDKSAVSLMPADLHRALSVQGIADVVEYLLTLPEAAKSKQ
jgi:putative membrane-bound dehydrogenase-like protein